MNRNSHPSQYRCRLTIGLLLVELIGASLLVERYRRDPTSAAGSAFGAGRLEEARHLAEDGLERRPGDPRWRRMAGLARASDDPSAIEDAPEWRGSMRSLLSAGDWWSIAEAALRQGQIDRAIQAGRWANEQQPSDRDIRQRLAALLHLQQDSNAALELLEPLLKSEHPAPKALALAGTIHHQAQRYERAIQNYQRLLSVDPTLDRSAMPLKVYWTDLTEDLIRIGRAEDAIRRLKRALRRAAELTRGERAVLWDLLAVAQEETGQVREAVASWRESVRLDAGQFRPWLKLGTASLRQGHYEDAREFLERAAKLEPEAPEPYYTLAILYQRQGCLEAAERARQRYRERKRPARSGMGAPHAPEMEGKPSPGGSRFESGAAEGSSDA